MGFLRNRSRRVGKGALATCPPFLVACKMVGTRSLSSGAHSRDPVAILQIKTVVSPSRSLRNLENQARRRRMREQPALGVGDARLCGGSAAADAERLAFAAHGA